MPEPVGAEITILPVEPKQTGCVIVPNVGAGGVAGCTSIITSADGKDVHPPTFVTVKL